MFTSIVGNVFGFKALGRVQHKLGDEEEGEKKTIKPFLLPYHSVTFKILNHNFSEFVVEETA
jgi:hypothetical protein